MMEKLGHAQTHVGLKQILKEVDEDLSGGISLREFLLVCFPRCWSPQAAPGVDFPEGGSGHAQA
jgi:hypothetical protein